MTILQAPTVRLNDPRRSSSRNGRVVRLWQARITPWLLTALLLTAAACGESRNPSTASTEGSLEGVARYEAVDSATDHGHVADPAYPATPVPPVRGAHTGNWVECRVYSAPVKDGSAVHSLEHGAVWITYQPDLPSEQVKRLATLARIKPKYVLVSPYPGQPGKIEASAWGLQLTAEDAGDANLKAFVRRYAGGDQGGEAGIRC